MIYSGYIPFNPNGAAMLITKFFMSFFLCDKV